MCVECVKDHSSCEMGGFSKKTTQKEVSQSEEKKIEMEEKWKNATKRWKEKKKVEKKDKAKKKSQREMGNC